MYSCVGLRSGCEWLAYFAIHDCLRLQIRWSNPFQFISANQQTLRENPPVSAFLVSVLRLPFPTESYSVLLAWFWYIASSSTPVIDLMVAVYFFLWRKYGKSILAELPFIVPVRWFLIAYPADESISFSKLLVLCIGAPLRLVKESIYLSRGGCLSSDIEISAGKLRVPQALGGMLASSSSRERSFLSRISSWVRCSRWLLLRNSLREVIVS